MPRIEITEWATWITDFLLFIQCFYFARILAKSSRTRINLWSLVFYISGAASILGAAQHGFYKNFDPGYTQQLGQAIIALLAVASLLLGWIFGNSFLAPGPFQSFFRLFLFAKLAFFTYQAYLEPRFLLAIADYGSTLILLLIAHILSIRDRPGSLQFVFAILLAIGGAAVQALKLAPHPLFNHNDVFHVVQMFSFYFFLQGARLEQFPMTSSLAFGKS